MLNKILKFFGYEKVSYQIRTRLNARDIEEMKDALRNVPHLKEFLETTIADDKERFYVAQLLEQPMVRGAIGRTRYILSLLEEEKVTSKKLNTPRYL